MTVGVVAVIPARGGSMGVPRKNVRPFCGRPLIAWSIDQARNAETVDRVFVTTEDIEIAQVAEECGAELIWRPRELAHDDTPLDPVIVHALRQIQQDEEPELVVTLQPTCPIRPHGLIDDCVKGLIHSVADSLFTVYEGAHFAWTAHSTAWPRELGYPLRFMRHASVGPRVNRQDIQDFCRIWLENGSVFVTQVKALLRSNARICGTSVSYEMNRWHSVDIDSPEDFSIAEMLFEYHQYRNTLDVQMPNMVNCHGNG